MVELNGYQATLPELLRALSEGGEAVVTYQNVNAVSSFQYAKGGTIIRAFDPLLPGLGQLEIPLPEEQGIVFLARTASSTPCLACSCSPSA